MIWSDHGNSQRSHWTGCRARGGELCLSKPRHGPEAGNRQDIRFSFLNVLYFNRRFGSKHRDFATSFPTLYAWQRAHVLAIHFRLLSEEGSKTIRLAITRGPAPPATPELLLPICPPETPLRPNLNTYWVVPHKFLAGEYPGNKDPVKARRKSNRFLEVGVRHFIDLTESGELVPYGSILSEEALRANITVTHERFPIPDLSVPRAAADLDEILLTIDRRIRERGYRFFTLFGRSWSHRSRGRMLVARALPDTGRRIGRTAPEMEHGREDFSKTGIARNNGTGELGQNLAATAA